MILGTYPPVGMMSEVEDSTLVESAMEMRSIEEGQENVRAEPTAAIDVPSPVSNQESMVALTLSRVKRQSKQIDNLSRVLGQLTVQFRTVDKRQLGQARQIDRQIRQVQTQLKQLQKQLARIGTRAAGNRRTSATKKARKSKARKR